ncbi:hypothetical protein KJ765_02605 [Candidatus Micrarchaeota archaeon]|nr:hypothetical protein [Candidatus Micrarchaeota archaeon]
MVKSTPKSREWEGFVDRVLSTHHEKIREGDLHNVRRTLLRVLPRVTAPGRVREVVLHLFEESNQIRAVHTGGLTHRVEGDLGDKVRLTLSLEPHPHQKGHFPASHFRFVANGWKSETFGPQDVGVLSTLAAQKKGFAFRTEEPEGGGGFDQGGGVPLTSIALRILRKKIGLLQHRMERL